VQEVTQAPEVTEVPKATETSASVFKYRITDEETVEITGLIDSEIEQICIPSTIEGCPVTSIGARAFWQCSSLTSIEIPEGETSIGYTAFEDCSSLTGIATPAGSYAEQWAKDNGFGDKLALE